MHLNVHMCHIYRSIDSKFFHTSLFRKLILHAVIGFLKIRFLIFNSNLDFEKKTFIGMFSRKF